MRTAQSILQDARDRFNTGIDSLQCPQSCTSNKSHVTSNNGGYGGKNCSSNRRNMQWNLATNNPAAYIKYCASFDAKIHYSNDTAYTCPGHRDSKLNANRYPNPNSIVKGFIIQASQLNQLYDNLKQEIKNRLNHIFYNDLIF